MRPGGGSRLYGAEYQSSPNNNYDVACAVCQHPGIVQTYVPHAAAGILNLYVLGRERN